MPENKERIINTSEQAIKPEGLVDVQARPSNKEVERWMEKVEKGGTTQKVINDVNGQPLLSTAAPTNPKVVLPITRQKFVAGFKKKVDDAGRWLSTFILKIIKTKDGEVEFKKENDD